MGVTQSLLIEQRRPGALGREETLMQSLAKERGVPVRFGSLKQVERKKCTLDESTVAVGSVPFVKHALRQIGKALPNHTPYPEALQAMLHRKVRMLPRLRDAKAMLNNGPLFIKPAEGWKRFTGFVAEDPRDLRFNGASLSLPVWTSDPVDFASEWRAYVAHGNVLDVRFVDHGGDKYLKPDFAVIDEAVRRVTDSGLAAAGYVIDFGVMRRCGTTALIEMNDGFSFGAYDGVSAEVYWEVTVSRWAELVQ